MARVCDATETSDGHPPMPLLISFKAFQTGEQASKTKIGSLGTRHKKNCASLLPFLLISLHWRLSSLSPTLDPLHKLHFLWLCAAAVAVGGHADVAVAPAVVADGGFGTGIATTGGGSGTGIAATGGVSCGDAVPVTNES